MRDDVVEYAWVFHYLRARWEGRRSARHVRDMREMEATMSFKGAHALREVPAVIAH